MCLLIAIPSLTASSQITGIDRRQKQEIVSTLQDYPLVMQELELTKDLLINSELRNANLLSVNVTLRKERNQLELKNSLTNKQLEIYRDTQEVERTTFGDKLLLFGTGVGVGTVLVFILKLL